MERQDALRKIEFWIATILFISGVFYLIANAVESDGTALLNYDPNKIGQTTVQLNYNQYYFIPKIIRYIVLYLAFLILNFKLVPRLQKRENLLKEGLHIALVLIVVWMIIGIVDTYLKNYVLLSYKTEWEAYKVVFTSSFFFTAWLAFMYGFYAVIKFTALYLLTNSELIQTKYRIVTGNGIIAFVLWMVSVFLLLISNADKGVLTIWIVIIPFGICLYWYSFYAFIPQSIAQKKPLLSYYTKVLAVLLLTMLPLALIMKVVSGRISQTMMVLSFNIPFQLLVTAPLSWIIYKKQRGKQDAISQLKSALGRSNANYDFLRSQINPHFLFNALNTIYGTALQENAERTSAGVEQLGDMMRFMLQENMQEKIPLSREMEYINNYISLQKLRTDTSPDIRIRSEIEEPVAAYEIAPMLLIPFIENAFKHGISLREPSYITIMLQLQNNKLFFDVTNSIHPRVGADPERYKSGIGLTNVRQRLELLYEGRHDLMIRESAKEFFVHLTLDL